MTLSRPRFAVSVATLVFDTATGVREGAFALVVAPAALVDALSGAVTTAGFTVSTTAAVVSDAGFGDAHAPAVSNTAIAMRCVI